MTTTYNAQIRSVAVSLPETVITNQHFADKYPEIVATARDRSLAKLWQPGVSSSELGRLFDTQMEPFVTDPFKGTVARRRAGPGDTALSLETDAAKKALAAAKVSPGDVDLLIVASFLPDQLGPGNGAYLARDLGLRGSILNLESACAGSVMALQTGQAMIRSGEHKTVLVVTSCLYSRNCDENDTSAWFLGDGAAAFLLTPTPAPYGVLGTRSVNTKEGCGQMFYELQNGVEGQAPRALIRQTKLAGKALREISETAVMDCCQGAVTKAGVKMKDIDFCLFNSPTAWYVPFCAKALGIPVEKTLEIYREVANIGPVLMPATLHRAVERGLVGEGSLILLYAVGNVANAAASVVRLGPIAVG